MSDDEEIAALVIDNGSGMCKGMFLFAAFADANWVENDTFV